MKQAMIFAAGLGTRLKPLTDSKPKALVAVGGYPLIDLVAGRLVDQGYDHLVVNVHHFAQQVIDHVTASSYAPLTRISDEREELLDTGGGLKLAAPLFHDDTPILIHNVDILSNVDFNWFSRQHLPEEDAVLLVSRRKTQRYLLFDNAMRLMGWTNRETGEVKSPFPWLRQAVITISDDLEVQISNHNSQISNLHAFAFSGIHSFSPRLFTLMERFPHRFPIMDFYLFICHRARIVGVVDDDLHIVDVGKISSLAAAESFLACSM